MRGLPRAEEAGEKMTDPLTCVFASQRRVDSHLLCALHDCWVDCQTSHFGEPPMCAYDEPDNSDEAMERRRAWREDAS